MAKIDSDAEKIFSEWLDFLLPKEMTSKELGNLAKKARLSAETLKKLKNRDRRGMSTDTFIRIALCRGASPNSLVSSLFKISNKSALDPSEVNWIKYGAKLDKKKRIESLDVIQYLHKKWHI